jgi:hypothetical protein
MAHRKPHKNNAKASQTRMLSNLLRALVYLDGHARSRIDVAKHLNIAPLTALRYLDVWMSLKLVSRVNGLRPDPFTYTALVRVKPIARKTLASGVGLLLVAGF